MEELYTLSDEERYHRMIDEWMWRELVDKKIQETANKRTFKFQIPRVLVGGNYK